MASRLVLTAAASRHGLVQQASVSRVARRWKGNIMPHRKPRWVPLADSTLLSHPKRTFEPEGEAEQCNALHFHYHEHLSAITQYLYQEHLKYSDVGEAAAVEAAKEEQEHVRLLRENDETNKTVAKRRDERLKQEMDERKRKAEQDLSAAAAREEERLRLAREEVEREEAELSNVITADKLEEAIEAALDNPVDYEYAIDTDGHIYRGRYTKCADVPPAEREKIPAPPEWGVFKLEEASGGGGGH